MACECTSCQYCKGWIGSCSRGYVYRTCSANLPADFDPERPLCRGCLRAHDVAVTAGNGLTPPSQSSQAPAPPPSQSSQAPAPAAPRGQSRQERFATREYVDKQIAMLATKDYFDQQIAMLRDYVDQQIALLREKIQELTLQVNTLDTQLQRVRAVSAGSESIGAEFAMVGMSTMETPVG